MSKRKIEVKEKELIDRLNNRYHVAMDTAAGEDKGVTVRWDNNGPIQFEEQADAAGQSDTECSEKKPYEKPMVFVDDVPMPQSCVDNELWKEDYFSGKTVEDNTVSLTPRDYDGSIVDIEGWDDNWEDRRDSRATTCGNLPPLPLGKAVEIEAERLMKNKVRLLALKKCLDAMKNEECPQPRTPSYEEVNHPQHYNNYDVEVIDMMERVFGKEATITFCKLNAFKYRMRAGTKPGQDSTKDLNKEKWYLDKMNELKQK